MMEFHIHERNAFSSILGCSFCGFRRRYFEGSIHVDAGVNEKVKTLPLHEICCFTRNRIKTCGVFHKVGILVEFPDAFVIESAKVYLASHVKDTLLVVSDDEDWKRAFDNTERAILCPSIKEAVKQINKTEKILSENQISTLLKINLKDLKILLEEEFNQSTYLLDGFSHDDDNEDLTVDEFYEFNIITDPTEIDLLRITRNFIVIQTYATCLVDGSAIVFDEDNSLWDSEDREYTYKSYNDIEFKHGKVETICEITISYDIDKIDDPLNCSQVNSLYFTDNENLEIELDEADIKSHEMSDDDMALRVLREDKGY